MRYAKDLVLRVETDVLVVGGGPAGCAAAVAAARSGAGVYLVEASACFGGLGTAGLVPAFMQFGDGANFCAGALGREFLERMLRYDGGVADHTGGYSIRAESLKRAYDDMIGESGSGFAFHTSLIDAVAEGGEIRYCVLSGKSGVYAARAKVYVDATGDGDLAFWSGAPCEKGDADGNMMAGTLCSLWEGIDWARAGGRQDGERLEDAIRDGVFERPDRHLPGMWRITDRVGGGNIGHAYGVDGTDERSLTEALVYGRRLIDRYERYYKEYLTGFENMELVATGSLMGIRETRRVMGEYVLTLRDFIDRASFGDEIGRYCYPVDIHASDDSVEGYEKFHREHDGYRYGRGESYGIPYRILVPRGVRNLLVAGRCVSTDRAMQSSIRVMPGCYLTGQAAGVAAAQCALGGIEPSRADVRSIQRTLKSMGLYLPNYTESP